jgi:dihydroxy-acid dehydratase
MFSKLLARMLPAICLMKICTSWNALPAQAQGSCGGQFTANTMACVSEAIGLAIPGSAGAPAPYESRDEYAYHSGRIVMDLVRANLRPRDILTRKAFENAATVVAASGGSTNAGLHLPALASECGIDFDLHDVAEIFKKTPYIADLKPGGRYVARDMFEIGGVPVLMKTLLDGGFLHGDCITVTGKTDCRKSGRCNIPNQSGCCSYNRCAIITDRRRCWSSRQSCP